MKNNRNAGAERITIYNALRYVDAIMQVVKRGIYTLPKENRALALSTISQYLQMASIHIHHYKEDMIKSGEATRTTIEQHNKATHTVYDSIIRSSTTNKK